MQIHLYVDPMNQRQAYLHSCMSCSVGKTTFPLPSSSFPEALQDAGKVPPSPTPGLHPKPPLDRGAPFSCFRTLCLS